MDIDVVFTDHCMDRDSALDAISEDLQTARAALDRMGFVTTLRKTRQGEEARLLVADLDSQIKVEVNFVFRGALLPVIRCDLVSPARDLFATAMELPVLAIPELYGSKMVAALDRQHPRDWFDVLGMMERFGLEPQIVDCFIGYLVGHNRPVHEVLFSNDLPLDESFHNDFAGMARIETLLPQLVETREQVRKKLPEALTDRHRRFLLSFVRTEPDWSLMPFEHLRELPAIRWKLHNLEKLRTANKKRFDLQATELMARFEQGAR